MWWKRLERQVGSKRRELTWRAVHWGWREFQRAGMVTADTPAGKAFARFGRGSLMAFPAGSVFGEGYIKSSWVVYTHSAPGTSSMPGGRGLSSLPHRCPATSLTGSAHGS